MNPLIQAAAPQVQIEALTLAYDKAPQPVLRGLNWTLQPGQVVGLLGRNGAGKTTLLEALLGLREPQSGSVKLFSQSADALDDAARARIGYVPQSSDLFENLTPAQLLAYFKAFYPRWNEAKVQSLMTRWAIPADQVIGKLSGGQQQRLSIIRALAHEPDLLVLDEPVASLDPIGRRDFLRELVDQVIERGTTVVFSTHILSDLERVAFNVAFMKDGQIALDAPLDTLLEQTRCVSGAPAAVSAWAQAHAMATLATLPARDGQLRVLLRGEWPDAGLPADLLVQAVSLDDLFEALT
jgi:ABC-2 type transport system ATP-binding protein